MNLSNCKTIEEYREAAHYWQKKWAKATKDEQRIIKLIDLLGSFEDDSFQTVTISGDDATRTWHINTKGLHAFGNTLRSTIDSLIVNKT